MSSWILFFIYIYKKKASIEYRQKLAFFLHSDFVSVASFLAVLASVSLIESDGVVFHRNQFQLASFFIQTSLSLLLLSLWKLKLRELERVPIRTKRISTGLDLSHLLSFLSFIFIRLHHSSSGFPAQPFSSSIPFTRRLL